MAGNSGMASNANMDPEKFRNTMSSLNYGNVMAAAARNLQKELGEEKKDDGSDQPRQAEIDLEDFGEDEALAQLQRDRMAQLKREVEKRAELHSKGHGDYREIQEPDFLPEVTGSLLVIVHFYHTGFENCRVLDKHLAPLSKKYMGTKFVKIHAPDAPFFVTKLAVKMLPCVIFFRDGKAYDRIVGFDELGAREDFSTERLERRLLAAGIVKASDKDSDSEDDESEQVRNSVRQSTLAGQREHSSDDEDSDFD